MQQNKQVNKNTGFSGTDPQKVKQQIKKDVAAGVGAMTSREAGAMRD
ncbi:hypothetical protein [Bacillus sp. FJAT-27916]|nr:hypothetical protein [Bacillus sp. FJAT-27916]